MQIEYLKKLYPKGYAIFLSEIKLTEYTFKALNDKEGILLFLMYLNKKGVSLLIQDNMVMLLHNNDTTTMTYEYIQFACCVPLSGEMIRISILHTFCSSSNYMENVVKAFQWLLSILESPIKPLVKEIEIENTEQDDDLPF